MSVFMNCDKIKGVVYTEKSNQQLVNRKYFFKVDKSCNKKEIASLIKGLFGVEVLDVNIVNTKPKPKRFKGILSKTKVYKKAIVTLKENNSINFGN